MQYTLEQYKAWGAKGGRARKKRLTRARRKEIAKIAALVRWARVRNGDGN